MFLNHDADEEIINFQEVNNTPDLSPKHSAERKSEKRGTQLKQPLDISANPSVRVMKNETYRKNLGNNDAQYGDEHPINLIRIEDGEEMKKNEGEIIRDEEECESVIQFQDIADQQSQIENLEHIHDSDIFSAQVGQKSVSPNKEAQSPSKTALRLVPLENNPSQIQSNIYPKLNASLLLEHTKEYMLRGLEHPGIVQAQMHVNASGLNVFRNKFYFVKDNVTFMAAKKSGSKFYISTDRATIDKSKAESFLGVIKCKDKNHYEFYDNGLNPKKHKEPTRKLLGSVKFELPIKPTQPRQQKFQFAGVGDFYVNKMPKFNPKTQSYSLNFYDRVKMSSIKNFQMIKDKEQPEMVYLQLGKEAEGKYNLDFHTPFSPLLAFMMALANYDKKIQY